MDSDTELARDLSTWSFDTIRDLVSKHSYEPGAFDFKEVMHGTGTPQHKAEVRSSIRKTAASMANTTGGHIIFGVSDKSSKPLAERLRGIPITATSDLGKQFGDLVSVIEPEVYFEASPAPILLPDNPKQGFFVVYVPPSSRRPHMCENVFWRRGQGGQAVSMNVNEVREQMVHTEERLRRIQVFRYELMLIRAAAIFLLVEGIQVGYQIDFTLYRSLLGEISPSLAPIQGGALVRELMIVPFEGSKLNSALQEYGVAYREAAATAALGSGVVGQAARVERVKQQAGAVRWLAGMLDAISVRAEEILLAHCGPLPGDFELKPRATAPVTGGEVLSSEVL